MSDHVEGISPRVAVLDIDGVLADVRHRLPHIEGGRRDWDAFFAGVADDPVLEPGRDLARRLAGDGMGIVYLTGRPERCREDTRAWLEHHALPEGELVMRQDRDRRPARLMKLQALHEMAGRCEVRCLVDDDPQVVLAARAAGFDVVVADWMPRSAPLDAAQETLGRS